MYATTFAVRQAVLNYVNSNTRVIYEVIRRIANAPKDAPLARNEIAQSAFKSFADRINAGLPLSDKQLAWLQGTKVSPKTGKLITGLMEQHVHLLIQWYGAQFDESAPTIHSETVGQDDAEAFLEDEEKDDLPF